MKKPRASACSLALVLGVLAASGRASAADAPAAPPPAASGAAAGAPDASTLEELPALKRPTLLHTQQFGVAVLPGSGYRVIFPYQENIDCGQQAKRVCTGRLPFFLDAQISFGLTQGWDAMVDLRFGIEQDFTQTHQFVVAPGFRYWVDPELHVKFFATAQVAIDTTDQQTAAVKSTDFALRNENGVMYDVMRNFGVYLQFGETIGFRRWLRFEIDGGVGVQARFP
jgi:hypothetical protein